MAFPGTMNINYYQGDTYEFRIYPKDSSGALFDLSGYDLTTGAKFWISKFRGDAGATSRKEAYAVISSDRTYILCAISPTVGSELEANTQWVYDVEITKAGTPYAKTYTLLTGTIDVTEQVVTA